MPLTAADVYSPQVPGLATILGSGLGSLRILQQEGYRRAREAAAKAKAAAELEKQFTPPAPDTDGGQVFAPQIAQNTKALLSFAQDKYKEAVQGSITPNDAKALVAQKLAETNTTTKRAKDSQAAIDKFKADARANNLDVSKVGGFVNMATTDPTTGQTMDINQFDPEALTQGVTNADVIDKAGAVQNFLKGLAGKQESDYSTAARLGGTGITRSASSNIFASDAQGRTIYTLDAQGNRVPKIANLRALEQAALQDPQMAALLRRSLEQGQKPTATALMGIGGEHVTDDQLEALNAQTDQNTGLERQSLADLLRPYGTLVQKQKETYLAPRAPRAATAADKKAPIYTAPVEGDYQAGGEVPVTPDTDANFVGYNAYAPTAAPTGADARPGLTQKGFHSQYSVSAPLNPTSNGPKRFNLGVTGTAFPEVYAPNEKGQYEYRTNNDKPIVGELDDAITLPVRPDGKLITPKDKVEYEKAMRDPRNTAKSFVQVLTPKDKNFAAKYEIRLKQLTDERNRQIAVGDDEAKRTTDATLADKAREEATGETVIQYLPNTGQNARKIDQLTKDFGGKRAGNYRAHREGVGAHQQRIRSSQPATKPNPLGFGAPKTAASAAPKLKTVGKNNALGF